MQRSAGKLYKVTPKHKREDSGLFINLIFGDIKVPCAATVEKEGEPNQIFTE